MFLALGLGVFAKNQAESQERVQILVHEWPTESIWKSVISNGGWKPIESEDAYALLKNHPDPFEKEPKIWISEDQCYVFLNSSPFSSNEGEDGKKIRVWGCALSPKSVPKKVKWRILGKGYEGVNLLSQIRAGLLKKSASYIDPKEIRY